MKIIKHDQNNFDFLRFVAACLVIIAHSCGLTGNGVSYTAILTKGQLSGNIPTYTFFMISGYLIVPGYLRTKNVFEYILLRGLRIFPALIVVVLLTVILVGPIVTTASLSNYFSAGSTYTYFKNILLYPMQFDLTGFNSNSATLFNTAVNGSLWTLRYTFTCYLSIAVLGIFRLLNKYVILLMFILSLFFNLSFVPIFHPGEHVWLHPLVWKITESCYLSIHLVSKYFCYFYAGAVFYMYKNSIVYNYKYLLASIIIIIVSCMYGQQLNILLPLFGTYIIFYIAFGKNIKLHNFGKYGDFSYGIYIYGFLIQQLVIMAFHGKMSNTLNFLISLPIAIICGVLSYYLVEKPCMSFKKYI